MNIKGQKKNKRKILTSIFGLSILSGMIIPLVGCSCHIGGDVPPGPEPETDLDSCVCIERGDDIETDISFWVETDGWIEEKPLPNLSYSQDDGETWQDYDYDNIDVDNPILIGPHSSGKRTRLYFRGDNKEGFNSAWSTEGVIEANYISFHIEAWCDDPTTDPYVTMSGSIMGLLDNGTGTIKDIPCDGCFNCLFLDNFDIFEISSDFLPSTKLKPLCYYRTFMDEDLRTPPSLPATNLPMGCYCQMFCSNQYLQSLPSLQIDTAGEISLGYMFLADDLITVNDESIGTEFFTCPNQWSDVECNLYAPYMFPDYSVPEPGKTYYYTFEQ